MAKTILTMLLFIGLSGCNGESPTAPTAQPVPQEEAHVYGTVSGAPGCIAGATIEILDGPQAGARSQQTAEVCSASDHGDLGSAYELRHLTLGTAPITIRASMPGFQSQEKSIVPVAESQFPSRQSLDFELVKVSP